MARELTPAQVRAQAEALHAYVRRGGAASRWLDSKDLLPAGRAAIVLAESELDDEDAPVPILGRVFMEATMARIHERQLPVLLTAGELIERGWSLSEEQKKKQRLESDKKASADTFKRAIETVEEEVYRLAEIVHSKSEYRPVKVKETRDYKRGVIEFVRLDTGEIVEARTMTEAERQRELLPIDDEADDVPADEPTTEAEPAEARG